MEKPNIYKRYRFPYAIIQYAVWLYYRFNLSHRDIEDLLAVRDKCYLRGDPIVVH
jgi:transposase-like protein